MYNRDNDMLKILIAIGIVLYIISPVDRFPGPVDDFIVTLLGMAVQRRLGRTNEGNSYNYYDYREGYRR